MLPPATNKVTIRIVLTLIIIMQLLAGVLNVKGAFSQEEFDDNKKQIYPTLLDRIEEYYRQDVLLKLLAPVYGLQNGSMAFCKKLKR